MATDWTFARRPIWLLGHLVAIAAVVVFTSAGMWQLDRHDQRRALNDQIDERLALPVTDLEIIADRSPDSIRFRLAKATGTFDVSEEVMLVLQTLDGVPGHRVLTPLVTDSSTYGAVLVDRGWVPLELDAPGDPRFAPPAGPVAVTGFVRVTQTEGRSVPDEGELAQIGRIDIARLQDQVDYELAPVLLHLAEPVVGSKDLPRLAPLPSLDPGRPHLSYAVQWVIFATVVVVGYAVLLFRTSRRQTDSTGSSAG